MSQNLGVGVHAYVFWSNEMELMSRNVTDLGKILTMFLKLDFTRNSICFTLGWSQQSLRTKIQVRRLRCTSLWGDSSHIQGKRGLMAPSRTNSEERPCLYDSTGGANLGISAVKLYAGHLCCKTGFSTLQTS